MKVRFSSHKEQDPTREEGMKVLYAPGKRAAFRLRWYLILLLVASPFIWFVGSLIMEVALTEAPARTNLPTADVRAMLTGSLDKLHVQPGSRVREGEMLASMRNESLLTQKATLEASLLGRQAASDNELQRSSLNRRVERARTRVRELDQLVAVGAATRGELLAARDQLDSRLSELSSFRQSLQPQAAEQQARSRDRLLLEQVRQQLNLLTVTAPMNGIVSEIAVVEGETVGAGTRLMGIRLQKEPTVEVYLKPELVDLAQPGQPLSLRFPDGTWMKAQVVGVPQESRRLPPDLRTPFSDHELGLVVIAEPESKLPKKWRLDNIPLRARFPNPWLRWWNFHRS